MCADSILSFPSVFLSSLLYFWCVWCNKKIIQSSHLHTTSPLFFSTSPSVTLLSTSVNSPSSHRITVWLCVVGALPLLYSPLPPLPFLVKERMRLEREEATRLLEEETEVRHSSSAGLQTTFLEVCAKGQSDQKYHGTTSTGVYHVVHHFQGKYILFLVFW